MREAIDPWFYVTISYAIGIGGTLAMIAWAWIGMKRAEARRDQSRERNPRS